MLLVVKFLAGNTILAGRVLEVQILAASWKAAAEGMDAGRLLEVHCSSTECTGCCPNDLLILRSLHNLIFWGSFFGCFQFIRGQFIPLLPFLPSGPCVVLPFLCPL